LTFLLCELLHLPLKLFRVAAKHFLLPALLQTLRGVIALLRQFLLAPGEFVELLERVTDVLRALIRGRSGLVCFVLIFLRVELEIEQAREIAASAAPSTAATACRAKRDLDLPEGSFGAQ
jgi:hypothetical protein